MWGAGVRVITSSVYVISDGDPVASYRQRRSASHWYCP